MTTKAELRASMRPMLRDATIWPDSAVDEWTRQAFAEYSCSFPRTQASSFAASTGSHAYDLYLVTGLHLGVQRVEYPAGQNPVQYLQRKAETDPEFYKGKYYDLRYALDKELIVIGPETSDGETITVSYSLAHAYPTPDASVLTVPDAHLDLIRLFVYWKATEYMQLEMLGDIGHAGKDLEHVVLISRHAMDAYLKELERVRATTTVGGVAAGWKMDSRDRIY